MNIARNHMTPAAGEAPGRTAHPADDGPASGDRPADLQSIDWRSLRSRLFAARDMLGVRGEDAAASRLRLRGSFDGCAASALHAYEEGSRTVNPDASSNGKPGKGKDNPVADVNASGERG